MFNMNCPIALCTHKFYLLCKEECNQCELSSLCVFSILICSPLWKNPMNWTNVDLTVENWKEKKIMGLRNPNRLIFILSRKKYTNGFCFRYKNFFHSSDLNERKKLSITKDTQEKLLKYIWDIADENSFALINRIRWMLKKMLSKRK